MANIFINPIQIWYEGNNVTINNLSMYSINDNLTSYSEFFYQLNNVTNDKTEQYVVGNLTCIGVDYQNWKDQNFSTDWILNWACLQLNLSAINKTSKK
jgi:hypothetical protein